MDDDSLGKRACKDGDRRFCYEVKKAALRGYVEPIWGWDEDTQIEFHRKDWRAQRPEIITFDNRDIGTIEIVRTEEGFHLGEFYLFPEYQRRGIGTHFLMLLVAEADAESLPIALEVIQINPVKSLYERFGFALTGETKTHYLMKREPKKPLQGIP